MVRLTVSNIVRQSEDSPEAFLERKQFVGLLVKSISMTL